MTRRRVLLVFPPHAVEARAGYHPVGIAYIAAYILRAHPEIEVKLIDYTVEEFSPERWQKELRDFAPEAVLLSVLTLNYPLGRLIADMTRQHRPETLVVMGGIHATAMYQECLEHCDIVVRGEGEITVGEILAGREWSEIRGICYKRDDRVVINPPRPRIEQLDELPVPAHHLLKMRDYGDFPNWGIIGSRGCPYQCTFCGSPQMWGHALKSRSADNIVDEIEDLHDNFGVRGIFFHDDTINVPQHRAIEICDRIVGRGLHRKMHFECQIRANARCVSPGLFHRMKEAGFTEVGIGIESASPNVLKSMRKSLTPPEAAAAIDMANRAGLRTKGFFMIGNWDEGVGDILKTWRFVLANKVQPAFSICTPLPGTTIYRRFEENGYLRDVDWANFNQLTALTRSNRLPRLGILALYAASAMLQLFLGFRRGHNARYLISRMAAHAGNMISRRLAKKKVARRLPSLKTTGESWRDA